MRIRSPRLLTALLIVAAGLSSGGLGVRPASADILLCRSDPILHLSNGASIHISVTVADDPADVQSLTYVVHGPIGTSLQSVTPAAVTLPETITYNADSLGAYTVSFTAQTGHSAGIGAEERVPGLGVSSTTGTSGAAITLSVG